MDNILKKYRAKSLDSGDFITGYYIHKDNTDYIINETGYNQLIIPNTLSIFTGLKDSEGVEIYTHDVIKYYDVDNTDSDLKITERTINVDFNDYMFTFGNESLSSLKYLLSELDKSEIISEEEFNKLKSKSLRYSNVTYDMLWKPKVAYTQIFKDKNEIDSIQINHFINNCPNYTIDKELYNICDYRISKIFINHITKEFIGRIYARYVENKIEILKFYWNDISNLINKIDYLSTSLYLALMNVDNKNETIESIYWTKDIDLTYLLHIILKEHSKEMIFNPKDNQYICVLNDINYIRYIILKYLNK